MPPKKRSYQTRSTNPAKHPQLSHGTESRQGSRQEDSSQQLEPPQEQLMTVNMIALSATISSTVKQVAIEALEERTEPSSSHSPEAPIAEQSVAEAVGASLASITQGTPQSYVNGLTLADSGQGSQVPKQATGCTMTHNFVLSGNQAPINMRGTLSIGNFGSRL